MPSDEGGSGHRRKPSMDQESPASGRCSRRRGRRVEETTRGAGNDDSCCQEGGFERIRQEGQESQEEKIQEEEQFIIIEEEKGEGQGKEESGTAFRTDRVRSFTSSPAKVQEESTKVDEEGQEGQVQQDEQVQFINKLVPGGQRRKRRCPFSPKAFLRGKYGLRDRGGGSRYPHKQLDLGSKGASLAKSRRRRGIGGWASSSSGHQIFPPDAHGEDGTSNEERMCQSVQGIGSPPFGEGVRMRRCSDSKTQGVGDADTRSALQHCQPSRIGGARSQLGGIFDGDLGCGSPSQCGRAPGAKDNSSESQLGRRSHRKRKQQDRQGREQERKKQRLQRQARGERQQAGRGWGSELRSTPGDEDEDLDGDSWTDTEAEEKATEVGSVKLSMGGAVDDLMKGGAAKSAPACMLLQEFDRGGGAPECVGPVGSFVSHQCKTLGDMGAVLGECASFVKRCKSRPLVTSNATMLSSSNLGVTGTSNLGSPPALWVALTSWGLQDLADEPKVQSKEECPPMVWEQLKRFSLWDDAVVPINFKQFMSSRNVDYQGEEVKVAQQIVWDAVSNSLPEGVGSLPLQQFCTLGTRHYVENFEDYLVPPSDQRQVKPPKVMVTSQEWPRVCRGLLDKGVCEVWPLEDLHHVCGQPLLNGMFSVGKGEYVGLLETQRLIMNLIPTNALCLGIRGDVSTLPMVAGFNGILLEEGEMILTSSEDIRCFFYLFSVPRAWRKYLGFNRLIPEDQVPVKLKGKQCVLVSRVLPMGFCNSVSVAQHIHRNIVAWSRDERIDGLRPEQELRRDKPHSSSKSLHRVYLDNFDLLEVTDPATAALIKDTPSPQVLALRSTYQRWDVPRHPKKAVNRAVRAEVQGALVLGDVGIVVPKPQKIFQYLCLGVELVKRGACNLKELQVVCGGFVYLAMFRRPLLSSLNQVWVFMEELKHQPSVIRLPLPAPVVRELFRFMCLAPLAQMNFRAPMVGQVTCSDASSTGGGFCISKGLTAYGVAASSSEVRGDVPEKEDVCQVLSVGLFDGLAALRVACDLVGLPMAGHISVECDPQARRVVESYFADTIFHEDVTTVGQREVKQWSLLFQNVGLVLIGAGPPCQGVSGLNAGRRGALKDHRSCLFQEVPRIVDEFKVAFPWAQVHYLGESVASMDAADRSHMNDAFDGEPWRCDSYGLALCHRPRLYWVTWELQATEGVVLDASPVVGVKGNIHFDGKVNEELYLEAGWRSPSQGLPTFTTPRPRSTQGRRPAGLEHCLGHEKQRWVDDEHRYPPYQYKDAVGLHHPRLGWRLPSASEKEAIMGFPIGYTKACMAKQHQQGRDHDDARHRLLGNSWQVGVVAYLVSQLGSSLGLCKCMTAQDIIDQSAPGGGKQLASLLLRPPMHCKGKVLREDGQGLAKKLAGLASIKGEDIMLQASSEQMVKYHRLRSSIPGALWRWREVVGWSWRGTPEHINVLELRAIHTTLRWLVGKRKLGGVRLVHLTDSLVCLHALSRGRTSSRKMRRILIRTQALLLRHDLHPLWGYIHTSQNPADRPSRRGRFVKKKWGKR